MIRYGVAALILASSATMSLGPAYSQAVQYQFSPPPAVAPLTSGRRLVLRSASGPRRRCSIRAAGTSPARPHRRRVYRGAWSRTGGRAHWARFEQRNVELRAGRRGCRTWGQRPGRVRQSVPELTRRRIPSEPCNCQRRR